MIRDLLRCSEDVSIVGEPPANFKRLYLMRQNSLPYSFASDQAEDNKDPFRFGMECLTIETKRRSPSTVSCASLELRVT